MNDPVLCVLLILALVCVVILFALIFTGGKAKKISTVQATVTVKKIKRAYVRSLANAGVSGTDWHEYYAEFRSEKGKKLELQLPKEIYDAIEEGDRGKLTYKGDSFVAFDKSGRNFVYGEQ